MVRTAVVVAAAFGLSACVTANASMLDERTAVISGRSHGGKSAGEVERKILVEAALEGRKRGFDYFQVVSAEDTTRSGVAYLPGQVNSTTTGSAMCAYSSCYGSTNSTTTGYGPRAIPFVQPGAEVTIHFYREGEIDPKAAHVWSVRSILAAQ
jgi:hypothetical protein